MTDQLQCTADTVVPLIKGYADQVLEWVKAGSAFAADQAPDIARQIVQWGIVSSALGLLIGLLLCGGTAWLCVYIHRNWEQLYQNDCEPIVTIPVLTGIVGSIVTLINLYNLSYILVAPKLYLIKQLTEIIH